MSLKPAEESASSDDDDDEVPLPVASFPVSYHVSARHVKPFAEAGVRKSGDGRTQPKTNVCVCHEYYVDGQMSAGNLTWSFTSQDESEAYAPSDDKSDENEDEALVNRIRPQKPQTARGAGEGEGVGEAKAEAEAESRRSGWYVKV
jgi:hypothetical protein